MNRTLIIIALLSLFNLPSCDETTFCEEETFALPEVEMIDPAGNVIEAIADDPTTVTLRVRAEAGLNTLTMKWDNIRVFTEGEKEATVSFTRWYWQNEQLEFTVHDLCDQSVSISVELRIIDPLQ